jgi:hypothetical protein
MAILDSGDPDHRKDHAAGWLPHCRSSLDASRGGGTQKAHGPAQRSTPAIAGRFFKHFTVGSVDNTSESSQNCCAIDIAKPCR